MDRRDLSIILIFLMLAVGGGVPQALHWMVDHNCCGSGCAVAHLEQTVAPVVDCCPHHHHAGGQSDPAPEAPLDEAVPAADEQSADEQSADDTFVAGDNASDEPFSGEHDCPVCQFLATLSAIVAPTFDTPIRIDAIEWAAENGGTVVARSNRTGSKGPRAPPEHII